MNNTGTPVFRPTASCIWSSFRSSGKHHLILMGGRGSGKTTLLKALCPQPLPGITTWAQAKTAVYLKDNLSGETRPIGLYDKNLPGKENKMRLCPDGFASLGVPALERCAQGEGEWVSIDEVGYLESGCEAYQNAICALMEQKRLMAVVRKQEIPFLQDLCRREDVFLVDLDEPYGSCGCVIMASGLGKRFGGNKLMAEFHGQPMIGRVLSATDGIFSHRVVVTRHEEVARYCRERGVDVVVHDLPYRSDTVRLGLEAVEGVERCMYCPGDQPLLRQETVAALVLAAQNDPEHIWRTAFEENPGAPVLFPKWAFPELLALPEGKGGGYVANKYPQHLKTLNVSDPYELMDVDDPTRLKLLLQR